MKNIKSMTMWAFILLIFPLSVTAAEKDKIPKNMQKRYDRRLEDMKAFDLNKDGVLQAGELNKSKSAKFDASDLNKDGILSAEETNVALEKFKSEKEDTHGSFVDKRANRLKNRYKNSDTNEDGQVSKTEYEAYMAKRQANFDRNGDGIISKEEYRVDDEKLPSSYRKKPDDE